MGHRLRTAILGHLLLQCASNVSGPSLEDGHHGLSPFTICLEGGRTLHDLHNGRARSCAVILTLYSLICML
eukprot:1718915-Amphidinium_carterae.2